MTYTGVAGVQTPAFVERRILGSTVTVRIPVSPEFRLRPSLSEATRGRGACDAGRVAGVQTPAFVERMPVPKTIKTEEQGVAGVQTPAFVERRPAPRAAGSAACVAGVQTPAFVERCRASRRRSVGASVAGVQTPAFVERATATATRSTPPIASNHLGRRFEVRALGHRAGDAVIVDLRDVDRGVPCRETGRGADVFADFVWRYVQRVAEAAIGGSFPRVSLTSLRLISSPMTRNGTAGQCP